MWSAPPPVDGSPRATRSFSTMSCARRDLMNSFTSSRPTTFSSSSRAFSVSSCICAALPPCPSPGPPSEPMKSTPCSTVSESLPIVPSENTRSVWRLMASSRSARARCAFRRVGSAHLAASCTWHSSLGSSASPRAKAKPRSDAMPSTSVTTSAAVKSGSTTGAGSTASSCGHRRRAAAMPSASPDRMSTTPFPALRARRSTSCANASIASIPGESRMFPASATGNMR
mmetsp:Transcript_3957/g.9579  ORF Transcript_3957/g.9579 Transcript_3957/m.9579 type:complete len:228 (+) Transcript_3957:1011-1694(+)